MAEKTSVGSWIGAVVVVLGVVAAGIYLARKAVQPPAPTTTLAVAPSSTATGVANTPIQHPIEQAQVATASAAPLPPLDDSDASVASALAGLAGGSDLSSLLVSRQLVARIVATVDALPRRATSAFMLPMHTPKGAFVTQESEGATVASEQNLARYAPYMQIVESADPQTLVAWYVHAYPLFQEAYRQLGYPTGYFNDRLIVVIDDLLAAPELAQPAALERSKAYYIYTDPALESLSAGQKMLLRVGPANVAKIKVKLRAIRTALTHENLHAASTGTAG